MMTELENLNKRGVYYAPTIEVYALQVEKGFATSDGSEDEIGLDIFITESYQW